MAHITAGTKTETVPYSVWNAGITSVSGSLTKGSTLTITGRDFGNGPAFSNCFYDGCDGTGARTVNDPQVGAWQSVGNPSEAIQTYESGGRDGSNCVRGLFYDTVDNVAKKASSELRIGDVKSAYISFWYRHMPNTFWPDGVNGSDPFTVSGRDTFSGAGSSAKLAWMGYADGVGGLTSNNDFILFSKIDQTEDGLAVVGNDTGVTQRLDSDWWGFGDWIRLSAYFELDPIDAKNNDGKVLIEIINPSKTQKIYKFEAPIRLNVNQSEPEVWDQIDMFSWYRRGDFSTLGATSNDDVDHRMDDFYVSSGNNSASRVELGDNADYNLCTERVLCYPDGDNWWSDSQVKVKVEQGDLNLAGDVWLFVIHKDGKRVMSWKVN